MNAIAQAESLLVASAAMRTERPFAQPPEHPLQGGFTDAAAAQRGADLATAARLAAAEHYLSTPSLPTQSTT